MNNKLPYTYIYNIHTYIVVVCPLGKTTPEAVEPCQQLIHASGPPTTDAKPKGQVLSGSSSLARECHEWIASPKGSDTSLVRHQVPKATVWFSIRIPPMI